MIKENTELQEARNILWRILNGIYETNFPNKTQEMLNEFFKKYPPDYLIDKNE